jgi:hypothetical protein
LNIFVKLPGDEGEAGRPPDLTAGSDDWILSSATWLNAFANSSEGLVAGSAEEVAADADEFNA